MRTVFAAWRVDNHQHHKTHQEMEMAREEGRDLAMGVGYFSCGEHIRKKGEGPHEGEELILIDLGECFLSQGKV